MNSNDGTRNRGRTWQLLIAVGVLWLLLAAALLIHKQRTPPEVEITWETATEQGTIGFSLYRSPTETGEFTLVNEDGIIESRGGPVSGANYVYTDNDVEAGKTYFYVLEEIEADGSRQRYEDDLIESQVPGAGEWMIILIAVCTVMGIAMLFSGLKEGMQK